MAKLMDYLEWHGNQLRVRMKVPTNLRRVFGKTMLRHPLHTSDLAEANRLKKPVIADMEDRFKQARKALANTDPITAEALQHRLLMTSGKPSPVQLAERREALFGPPDADREVSTEEMAFLEVATGASTALDHHLDAFADFKAYALKSRGDLKRAVGFLTGWLKSRHVPATVEEVDRKLAGRFIDTALASGRGSKKAGSYLGFLREYWRWLVKRGHADDNPWLGQEVPAEPRRPRDAEPDEGKRPYTDDELAKLVYGPAKDYLPHLMRVAALTGMRIGEICELRVRDHEGDTLKVRDGKTDNAKRVVPIHPDLAAIIEARTEGRDATGFLFHELPPPPPSREGRSDPAVKRFTRYRREMGVDERPNGKAKSNVEFHSFRRWFVRKAQDALASGAVGFTAWTIADLVGHDDGGVLDMLHLTMSHYPGPSPEAAKRACVEAVRLPPRPTPRTP